MCGKQNVARVVLKQVFDAWATKHGKVGTITENESVWSHTTTCFHLLACLVDVSNRIGVGVAIPRCGDGRRERGTCPNCWIEHRVSDVVFQSLQNAVCC